MEPAGTGNPLFRFGDGMAIPNGVMMKQLFLHAVILHAQQSRALGVVRSACSGAFSG